MLGSNFTVVGFNDIHDIKALKVKRRFLIVRQMRAASPNSGDAFFVNPKYSRTFGRPFIADFAFHLIYLTEVPSTPRAKRSRVRF